MPYEQGYILSIEGDGWAQVTTERNSACSHCEAASQCCQSMMYSNRMTTRAVNKANAREGDIVQISMNAPSVLKAALLVYMVPLVGLLLGSLLGGSMGSALSINQTTAAIVFAALGLIGGFGIAFVVSKHLEDDLRYIPVVTRVVRPTETLPQSDAECRACSFGRNH